MIDYDDYDYDYDHDMIFHFRVTQELRKAANTQTSEAGIWDFFPFDLKIKRLHL